MSRTVSASTNRPYGLLRVAQVWSVSRATVCHRQRLGESLDQRAVRLRLGRRHLTAVRRDDALAAAPALKPAGSSATHVQSREGG